MKDSLWQKYRGRKKYSLVTEDKIVDVLIVGAGITGITTAYFLSKTNKNIMLIDREKLYNSTTAKSTAKITYLQDLKYQDILNNKDFEHAKLYYESQKDAINLVKRIVSDNNIECDLTKTESITYSNEKKYDIKFDMEKNVFDKLGVKYNTTSKYFKNIPRNLISVKDTYTFNPVKYLKELVKILDDNGIQIYENSIATKIECDNDYYVVYVNNYKIQCKKIVVATNYPFFTIPGLIPLKTYMEKSYIAATKVDDIENVCGITNDNEVNSFRYYDDGKNKYYINLSNSSKICDKLNYEKNYSKSKKRLEEKKNKKADYIWTNMDAMSNDFIPLIGKVSNNNKDVYIATGYNTWGMTNGTIAAKLISDLINNKKSKYEKLFNPSRLINVKNFVNNTLISNIKAYSFNFIKKNPSWYNNKALVTCMDGKRVGIYIDSKGNRHVVSNICPHLKCFLTFNSVDKTWDCPCHGSRFDIYGNAVKGPSVYNIKIDGTKF